MVVEKIEEGELVRIFIRQRPGGGRTMEVPIPRNFAQLKTWVMNGTKIMILVPIPSTKLALRRDNYNMYRTEDLFTLTIQ